MRKETKADFPEAEVRVRVAAPASLSNLGPGFDALGLCITGFADEVEVWPVAEPGVHIRAIEGPPLPLDARGNTAAVAARYVLEQAGYTGGLGMCIRKGIPIGSGIGGSAASAVGGAWAANVFLGKPFTKEALVDAVLAGEAVASGSIHGDNVLPALLGGLVLVYPEQPQRYVRLMPPSAPAIVLLLPEVEVLTREAREILPETVTLREAVTHAAHLAFLLQALQEGNWREAARWMMEDRLVEPRRARLLPGYTAIRSAALEAGATGCALSGSGPALFALVEDAEAAEHVAAQMLRSARESGLQASVHVVGVHPTGVSEITE